MYAPNEKILNKYADVLVNFALWGGKGIKPGEVVLLSLAESAKPMLQPLMRAVLEADAHYLLDYHPEGTGRFFYDHASEEQLTFAPRGYLLQKVKTCDHFLSMISTDDKFELRGADAGKIMARQRAFKFYLDARRKKEDRGEFTWTLGLFGTEAMAAEAKMSLQKYWEQIIQACYLDAVDPIGKWQEVFQQIESIKRGLNKLQIETVHIEGDDMDLTIKLGEKRQWLGGGGRNIPSFEIFVSPDWRGTNGRIKFNQPLYRYGNLIRGIELEFKDGKVVQSKVEKNQKLLREMITVKNADKVGEFSLTDRRFSRITRFMAETLYDENMGGEFGNMHIALGAAYRDSYSGDPGKLKQADWVKLGYNDSVIHTDIVSTTNRTVTAHLKGGKKKVIYRDGEFQV